MTFFAFRSMNSRYCPGIDDTAAALETETIAGHPPPTDFNLVREKVLSPLGRCDLTVFLVKDNRVFVICYHITEET